MLNFQTSNTFKIIYIGVCVCFKYKYLDIL